MKTKANCILLCLIVIAVSTLALAKSKADVRDVTGCLSKGDSAHEFMLTGNDGDGSGIECEDAQHEGRRQRSCKRQRHEE